VTAALRAAKAARERRRRGTRHPRCVEGCKGRKRGAREHASGDGAALATPSAPSRDRRTQQRVLLGRSRLKHACRSHLSLSSSAEAWSTARGHLGR
jgi:hypothetical protein